MASVFRLLPGVVVAFGLAGPSDAAGALTQEEITAHQVNIAGRQRMLSQRILAAACLTGRGADAQAQSQILADAVQDFATGLDTLENGRVADGLPPLAAPAARAKLEDQRRAWTEFAQFTGPAAAGDAGALAALSAAAPPLLASAVATVGALAGGDSAGAQADLARYVDLAGRQRLLSQRLVGAACLGSAGISVPETQAAIGKDLAEFEANLTALADGDPARGIEPAPSLDMRMALETIPEWWQPVRGFAVSAQATPLDAASLSAMAEAYEPLLERLEEAVWMAGEV